MKKIRVFTAFSGYDSQCMALDRLGIDYELVGWSEIDKYAIKAHNAVYPQWADRNYGDISKIDWSQVPDFDLFTMSSPCQDFSNAGRQAGGEEGSGTRSSLLWECRKAIVAKKPKWIIFENVSAIAQDKFVKGFNKWQYELEQYGYTNHTEILNSKYYGVAQNRERLFMVSILNEQGSYCFEDKHEDVPHLYDILEPFVDSKYYLSDKIIQGFKRHNEKHMKKGSGFLWQPKYPDDIANCLRANSALCPTDNTIIEPLNPMPDGCSRTIKCQYAGVSYANFIKSTGGHAATGVIEISGKDFRIRKFTERECFRLMGVSEGNIDKIQASGISRTQQYKMAGNSIVVDVLFYIFRNLFYPPEYKTSLF